MRSETRVAAALRAVAQPCFERNDRDGIPSSCPTCRAGIPAACLFASQRQRASEHRRGSVCNRFRPRSCPVQARRRADSRSALGRTAFGAAIAFSCGTSFRIRPTCRGHRAEVRDLLNGSVHRGRLVAAHVRRAARLRGHFAKVAPARSSAVERGAWCEQRAPLSFDLCRRVSRHSCTPRATSSAALALRHSCDSLH